MIDLRKFWFLILYRLQNIDNNDSDYNYQKNEGS